MTWLNHLICSYNTPSPCQKPMWRSVTKYIWISLKWHRNRLSYQYYAHDRKLRNEIHTISTIFVIKFRNVLNNKLRQNTWKYGLHGQLSNSPRFQGGSWIYLVINKPLRFPLSKLWNGTWDTRTSIAASRAFPAYMYSEKHLECIT